jgi:hypothetical protein
MIGYVGSLLLYLLGNQAAETTAPQCTQRSLNSSDLEGTWDAFHYLSDRYFSLRLKGSGKGTLAFVAGPALAPFKALLAIKDVRVTRGRIHAVATLPNEMIVVEGCVIVSGLAGIIEDARLTLSGPKGEFPQTLRVTFTRGDGYLSRMSAFKQIAGDIKEGWKPPPERVPRPEEKANSEFPLCQVG